MTIRMKIRLAPNGKFYVMFDKQPICDAAGGLLYFDDKRHVLRFLERRTNVQVVDVLAA